MLGPFATASRFTLSFTTATTVTRHLRIDVHDNDNACQKGPLWPHEMGPTRELVIIIAELKQKLL